LGHHLYTRANDGALAYFVKPARFVYSSVAVLIYALAKKYEKFTVGYGILILFSALMAYSPFINRRDVTHEPSAQPA
jgi:hypothetical protein